MLVRILGVIDFASAIAFLMLIFGIDVFLQFMMFCTGLLFLKGFFIFTGDVLSAFDLIFAIFLLISLFFTLPAILLWIAAFVLMAKAFVSFV